MHGHHLALSAPPSLPPSHSPAESTIVDPNSPAAIMDDASAATTTNGSSATHLEAGRTSPKSAQSQSSAGALSEASSEKSGGTDMTSTSSSSAATSTTTGASSNRGMRSKVPTLEHIAARMGKTALTDKQTGGKDASSSMTADSDAPPRLSMQGRLNSNSRSESLEGTPHPAPARIVKGEPPSGTRGRSEGLASLRDKAANRSRSVSPVKQHAPGTSGAKLGRPEVGAIAGKNAPSTMAGKEMPTLQDIIDRMSKKGISSSSSSNGSNTNATAAAASPLGEKSRESDAPGSPDDRLKSSSVDNEDTKATEGSVGGSVNPPVKNLASSASAAPKGSGVPPIAKIEEKVKVEEGHPLQHKWTMYFDSKHWNPSTKETSTHVIPDTPGSPSLPHAHTGQGGGGAASTANSWEAALKMLGVYTTVENFMSIFSTLRRPSQLERNSNYHLFKDGIKPMWEDAANQNGGKWIITLKGTNQALLDRSWMWLVLALIGEQLDDNDDITGAVVSTRSKGDRIALWIRNKSDVDLVNKIGRKFAMLMDLEKEPGVSLEFVPFSTDDGGGSSRMAFLGAPSKFISFSNPPAVFTSPVFGHAQLAGAHHHPAQINRVHASPGKGIGMVSGNSNSGTNRLGPARRGSEHGIVGSEGASSSPFGMGAGAIGRTASPNPTPGRTLNQTSSLSGVSSLLSKARSGGQSMLPPAPSKGE